MAKISLKHRPWLTNQHENRLKAHVSRNLRSNESPCRHWDMTVFGQALTTPAVRNSLVFLEIGRGHYKAISIGMQFGGIQDLNLKVTW